MINHPYKEFENSVAWKVIDKAITGLVENQDLKEMTAREYIVGYLVQQLSRANALSTVKNDQGAK